MAFSYQGDIWVYDFEQAQAQRLSLHEAYESHPVFSPDESSLAFVSRRYGNADIFRRSLTEGTPERLSYHSANDILSDWNAELGLLFETRRNFVQVERETEIHQLAPEGGTPQRLLDALGKQAVASPSGRFVLFARGACRLTRENYRGPAANQLWLYDRKEKAFAQLTDSEYNQQQAQFINEDSLIYLSAEGGYYNLMRAPLAKGLSPQALSQFDDYGIEEFTYAAGRVVFSRKGKIYLARLGSNALRDVRELQIELPQDYRNYPQERKTFRADISDYALSPSGKWAMLEIHGELFVSEVDKEKKMTRNLSQHPFRDQEALFVNDSVVLFSSDRAEGQYRLYRVQSREEHKRGLLESLRHDISLAAKTKDGDISGAVFSPDRSKIAYIEGGSRLMVAPVDAEGNLGKAKKLWEAWHGASSLTWSPDGSFLAYSHSDLNFNSEVYILPADGSSEAINVSRHPGRDYSPVWSPDGTKLAFISERNNRDADLWFVWLQREEWLKSREEREQGYYFADEADEEEEKPAFQIDLEGLADRLQQVTSLVGGEGNALISKDGKTFYFTRYSAFNKGSDLYSVQWDGSELKAVTSAGISPRALRWDADYKNIYYLSKGKLASLDVNSGKSTTYPHEAKMIIDHPAEREQIFDEAWRLIRDRFYDPQFHGYDWEALKAQYRPRALAASTGQDFRHLFNLMVGRLNASHMGMYGSDEDKVQRERTGLLGLELLAGAKGLAVTKVVPNSPADRGASKLEPGDIILAVNEQPITATDNFYRYLAEATEEAVLLKVRNSQGEERELVIRPSASMSTLLYEEWVQERQRLTEEYSGGRLGYLHIKGMDKPSFERFERELMASGEGKEGLVIDVRYNGGGWTTDYLMAVLSVRQHAYTVPRGAAEQLEREHPQFADYYPYSERLPLAAWTKPAVALCNESSYSNAEIFSHAFKSLERGPLVGQPTFGAVISTGGARLLDGALVRLPFRGWYVKDSGLNMENGPAVPDILVPDPPHARAEGSDPQLRAAVEALLSTME